MAEAAEEFSTVHRIERSGFGIGLHEKAIRIQIYIENSRQLPMVTRLNAGAEDHRIDWERDRTIHRRIEQGDLEASLLESNLRLILQVVSNKDYTLFSRLVVTGLIKSVGPHVAVEHIDIHPRIYCL